MEILNRTIIILALLFPGYGSLLFSQDQVNKTTRLPDLKFSDGIYIDFDQVRTNNPVPPNRIVSATDYKDREFYKNLLTKKNIGYYDNEGTFQNIERDSVWGFSNGGIMNVQVEGKFYPITTVGRICHFIADIESKEMTYDYGPDRLYSPYRGYYDRLYPPYSIYPPDPYAIYDPLARTYYSPYSSMYPPRKKEITRSEPTQFLLDFDTGTAYEFDPESTAELLRRDPQLFKEFDRLPVNKKRALMFVYINKFNERNPLILPERKQ